jgi:hypothetical protein
MRFIIFTALLMIPMLVLAAPGIPHQLYGSVHDFTSGTVSVVIGGATIATASIASDGTFGTSGSLLFVEDPNNTYAGETMTFKINNSNASGSLVFQNGGFNSLTLSVASEGTGSGSSAGGSTPVLPIKAGPYDFNGDGVVDIQDYNFLISYWGTPEADLNADGTTNILDFNILMAYWT